MTQLLKKLFPTTFDQRIIHAYQRFFSIQELEKELVLKWVFGASLFSYFTTFSFWVSSTVLTADAVEKGYAVCRPYFQGCTDWLFLHGLPNGYSQTVLYMGLFGLMLIAVYLMYRKEWVLAHMSIVLMYLWHALATFILSGQLGGNYDYYLFVLTTILLFLPHKEFFLKLCFVLFYALSTVAKIHPAWVAGTYFSALQTGLPLFPDWSIPFWTNLVIFMEMVGAWFLLSRPGLVQRLVLVFFIAFHLYSGILVKYHYPSVVLPTLIILFGLFYRKTPIPFDRRSIAGWVLVGLLVCMQSLPLFIPGDEKLTLEGNKYGLYMFESNHQCISTARITFTDGSEQVIYNESANARARCEPYRYWFRLNAFCKRNAAHIQSAAWTFDHSINGGPFLRIVDTDELCALQYRPLTHNDWIKTHSDEPEVVGYPVENIYD
ncbi:hypothetical protein COU17_00760 [Candidatus Kaiserbacteria bacterium CG10_big_fil_rev_8_21_14_0_10_49_17]|uniref:HTTM domain-containing protein n=1 Tax=Candidatus Kaiserbacteria bacterium CG10_big_fil_rev_8_21_14_0_10_49_17 TaxID=1974609 RepID=A0A2M6WEW0_9BACT|nr:MAG: hypothetical protein COU17_00760 [Candidatus Kaiserbacteria bacterium CG10_big_fil_rev_8_21_14_0_10_49_17]